MICDYDDGSYEEYDEYEDHEGQWDSKLECNNDDYTLSTGTHVSYTAERKYWGITIRDRRPIFELPDPDEDIVTDAADPELKEVFAWKGEDSVGNYIEVKLTPEEKEELDGIIRNELYIEVDTKRR